MAEETGINLVGHVYGIYSDKQSLSSIQRPLAGLPLDNRGRNRTLLRSNSALKISGHSDASDGARRCSIGSCAEAADSLDDEPRLYGTSALAYCRKLFEELPEVGEGLLEQHRRAWRFFWSTRHLLFRRGAKDPDRPYRAGVLCDPGLKGVSGLYFVSRPL